MMASFDPKTTLLVMALAEESGDFFENAGHQPLYTGIGQVKAATALTKAIFERKPATIINLGTAGSFHLVQGQCVECSGFIQRRENEKGPFSKKIQSPSYLTSLPRVVCGTADFIQTEKQPEMLFEIMDMEGYALAYAAQQFQIPFFSIKYISDNSNGNIIHDWKKNLISSREKLLQIYLELIIQK